MNNIVIDTISIATFQKKIYEENDKLINILDQMNKEITMLDEILESESGNLYKEKIYEIINHEKRFISDNNISFINNLQTIIKTYNELNTNIEESVNSNGHVY